MRGLLRAIVLLSACAVIAACTKTGGRTAPGANGERVNAWTIPHVLRYADAEDVNTLNPWFGQDVAIGYMSSLTMAWLIKWDVHNAPYPELATQVPTMKNGGVSPDGLTITYHLRKGVKWSDGAPFTADDVVFSLKQMLNPANDVISRTGWNLISKIDEPDKYTVVIHLRKPYSPFLETFFSSAGANPCVLPKHLLDRYANLNHVAYNSLPVGIGPFKFKEWDRGQKVVMVANPLYFRGEPKLRQIIYEIIPNRNTVQTELEGKQLDMWAAVPGNNFVGLKGLSAYAYIKQPSYAYNHLDFNTRNPKVSDPIVREALRYAINRPELRAKIGHGIGILSDEPASPAAPYYDPKIALVPFDLAKANQLLDQDGWKRGPDGIREKNGVRLSLDVATSSGTPDVDSLIELIRTWWKQIGVSMNVQHYESALLFAPPAQGGIIYSNKWDVAFFQWVLDPEGDFSALYGCDQIPPNGQNVLRWCNPQAQAAMKAFYTHYDQAQRNADDAIVQEAFYRDVPSIVTSIPENIYVFNRDLKNFHPNQVTPFDNMMDVDI